MADHRLRECGKRFRRHFHGTWDEKLVVRLQKKTSNAERRTSNAE
jgi:hypothetical protein